MKKILLFFTLISATVVGWASPASDYPALAGADRLALWAESFRLTLIKNGTVTQKDITTLCAKVIELSKLEAKAEAEYASLDDLSQVARGSILKSFKHISIEYRLNDEGLTTMFLPAVVDIVPQDLQDLLPKSQRVVTVSSLRAGDPDPKDADVSLQSLGAWNTQLMHAFDAFELPQRLVDWLGGEATDNFKMWTAAHNMTVNPIDLYALRMIGITIFNN